MLDLSELTLCPEQINDLFTGYIAAENWFNRVQSMTGITGSQVKVLNLKPTGDIVPCCTPSTGTDTPGQIVADIICAKLEKDFCENDLMKIMGEGVRVTAGGEAVGRVGQKIADAYVKYFARSLTDIAFNGGTFNGNPYEGYLAQAGNTVDLTTATHIVNAIYAAYAALPVDTKGAVNIGIFVGSEVAPVFQSAMMFANLYHFNPGTKEKPLSDMPLPGIAGVTIIPVSALNGKNKMMVTPLENMYWFANMIGDKDSYIWAYSVSLDKWFLRIKTLFGVAIASPEDAVVATFNPGILVSSVGMPVNILGPLNAAGNAVNTATVTA